MSPQPAVSNYHALLIGIDRYPPAYRSLAGCVNDIDAVEKLLLESPGIGISPECVHITRLAAERAGRASTSSLQAATLPPTKANVVAALKKLAGPDVGPNDRVLIYYSGHGDEKQWTGSQVWHESLVPHNDKELERLFDVEINGLIAAIAARTDDLTVVFDCCHSAGATRDLSDGSRSLESDDKEVPAPDLAALGLETAAEGRSVGGPLLKAADPSYLVIAACQPDETAKEGEKNDVRHGSLTYALLRALEGRDAEQRAKLRWADIWPDLLARVEARNVLLNQGVQHPWPIGRTERKVFGGEWERTDPGYRITRLANGDYEIGAGQLMGITEAAEVAVYGRQPVFFPPIGSPEDQPIGRLKVSRAERSTATAVLIGPAFELEGARGRLVKAGSSQRLQVSVKPADAELEAELSGSALLEMVSASGGAAEVEVIRQPNGDWIIRNDVEPVLAVVPEGRKAALTAALEHYHRYNTVVRMARTCSDPQIAQCLTVQLLDCSDNASLAAMTPEQLADPQLPEAPRDKDRIYTLPKEFKFCVKVTNASTYPLLVTLLACSSGGMVQPMSDTLLRANAAHVMWLDNNLGSPFETWPDEAPAVRLGAAKPAFVTDRIIALGTTRPDVDLHGLYLDKTVQQVVDENTMRGDGEKGLRPATPAAPSELWTATLAPVSILLR